jgi:glycine hydroxymethyltransferase
MVSSCAIDSDGYLTGQAFVNNKSSDEGTAIAVFQSAPASSEKPPAQWKPGDRIKMPSPATVISRFPKM